MKNHHLWSNLRPSLTNRNLLILSGLIVILVFFLQGNVSFNIPDEGFLWYGTVRTALGEVPVRDFQSYEPGRYYWGALWFKLLRNDGLLALRFSQTAFQFVGLSLALLLLRRVCNSWLAVICAALILVRWMFPSWKVYEPAIMIAAIYFAVLIIEKPSRKRHLIAGIFIGLAAFFGRNHGVYCTLSFALLIVFESWKAGFRTLFERLASLAFGIVVGYLPMFLMLAFVAGFRERFIQDLLFNLHYATTIPIPVPWPWRQTYTSVGIREAINRLSIGFLYLGVVVFYVLALGRLLFKRVVSPHPIFIASTFVGLTYLHYTFGRPQLYYLAWTIPPLILGLIAVPVSFPPQFRKTLLIIVWTILVVSTVSALEFSSENYFTAQAKSFVKTKLLRRYNGDFTLAMNSQGLERRDIRGDSLWVTTDVASIIDGANAMDQHVIPKDEPILVAPYLTGLYALWQKQSPLWEIYFLLPQPVENQKKMVEDLERKHVNWAVVCHNYIDDRPELAFQSTHHLLWQYLSTRFERVQAPETRQLADQCELMRRVK